MSKNIMKKTLSLTLAVAGACASLVTMTACETSHPEVEMVLEFNDQTYTLEYELNRNLTPSTVKHFLSLVDGGFYNGLCVHDYQTSAWYTGVYEYKEDTETLAYRPYFAEVKKLEEKGLFTPTVWMDEAATTPTYTLYGEFKSNNGFSATNGKITNGFGALTMRYTDKGDTSDASVWCQRSDGDGGNWLSYGYNSATSMFSINVSKSAATLNDYCTFATLNEDSVEVLQDLQDAIAAFIGEENEDVDFAPEKDAAVNEEDPLDAPADEQLFKVPVEPIVIKTMKVTKW